MRLAQLEQGFGRKGVALQGAFEQFSRQTAELERAYGRLKAETRRINLQLEEANRALAALRSGTVRGAKVLKIGTAG